MTPRFTVCLSLALVAISAAACGSDVESDPDLGSGGSGASTSSTASSSPTTATTTTATTSQGSGGDEGTGGAGGGPACDPYDQECNCEVCDGVCVQACNFGPQWSCQEPGPLAENQFSCGGWTNCDIATEACVHVTPYGDGCIDYFCAPIPLDCRETPTCECLAPMIDGHDFDTSCTEGEGIELEYSGYANDPPWDEPVCGVTTCEPGESCWACTPGGSPAGTPPSLECSVGDPGPVPGHCSERWYAAPDGTGGAGGGGDGGGGLGGGGAGDG